MSALYVVLLLAVAACPGGAIKCYNCVSDTDPHCADPIDRGSIQPTDCGMEVVQKALDSLTGVMQGVNERLGTQLFPHGETKLEAPMVCSKIDLIGADGRNHTARMCSLKAPQNGDLCHDFKTKTSPQKVAYCGVCEEDGCNGTARSPAHPWLAAATLIALAPLLRRG